MAFAVPKTKGKPKAAGREPKLAARERKGDAPKGIHRKQQAAPSRRTALEEKNEQCPNKDDVKESTTLDAPLCVIKSPSQVNVFPSAAEPEKRDYPGGDDPFMCVEYKDAIIANLLEQERARHYVISERFLLNVQRAITPRMRAILVNWLTTVHVHFKLLPETFQMAIDLLDRVLQVRPVSKDRFQLVGVTCVHVAAKYEEVYPPTIDDYAEITDNAYTIKDILREEVDVLKTLHYRVSRPLTITFLRQLSVESCANCIEHAMAKFVVDVAMMDATAATLLPSRRAAAALRLAEHMLAMGGARRRTFDFRRALRILGDEAEVTREIEEAVVVLRRTLRYYRESKLHAAFDKYANATGHYVSRHDSVSAV
ncbi:G2/mitotic-specific cyclin-B2-like [Oscarella lobularis]|uniref:G2/mitotic-specific cyclin-B2-like n=1 Tax=Oscarella lobularis TaxID=121494 RepID=UPI0033134CB7